jgi:hypothetical protein
MRPLSHNQADVLVRLVDSNIIRASDGSWIWVSHPLAFAPATTITIHSLVDALVDSLVDRGPCSIRGSAQRDYSHSEDQPEEAYSHQAAPSRPFRWQRWCPHLGVVDNEWLAGPLPQLLPHQTRNQPHHRPDS